MKFIAKTLFLYFFFGTYIANAQQIAGGEITYVCAGNDTYQVKLVLYGKCPNPNLPSTVKLNIASNSSATSGFPATLIQSGADETIKACIGRPTACENGTGELSAAITKRTYLASVKLPSKQSDWSFTIQEGPRTSVSSIEKQEFMSLTAIVNNTGTFCNSSATFDNNPLFFSSSNLAVSYDPGIKNPDSDILDIKLVSPKNSPQTSITYNSPYSSTNPFTSQGAISVNPTNGKISFTPTKPQETSILAIQIKETRGGVVVGSVTREMYFQTLSEQTSPPIFQNQDTIKLCQGDPGAVKITGNSSSSNTLDIVFNNQSQWPGSTPSIVKGIGKAEFNISAGNFTGVRPINLTLVDDKCGMVTKTFYVQINPKPVITNPIEQELVLLCVKPFPITVTASGGKLPYKYSWANSNETSATLQVTSATNQIATVTDGNNCSATWIKRIKSPINFDLGQIRCADSLIKFYDISNGQTTSPLTAANPLPETKDWKWTFDDGSQESTGPNPSHKFPNNKKTYNVTLTVSDGKGCTNSLTKNVKVYGNPVVQYSFSDTCQVTEQSDLKVKEAITGGDTTIQDTKIIYFVDGKQRTVSFPGDITALREFIPGPHVVKVKATNDAGCVTETAKSIFVRPKPIITASPLRDNYYYRCDSPNFPDTSFIYSATPVGEALNKPFEYSIDRSLMPKLEDKNYTPNGIIKVDYTVKQNSQNEIYFRTKDGFGCTNDTILFINDPITPKIELRKYYCFLNDTLKLKDINYPSQYHWKLSTSIWDMKDGNTETTFGYANHAYSTLDEANVVLKVTDATGCSDKDSIQVYLSEPDTSQFRLSRKIACNLDTVTVFGIKNKYINSWYYRYADTVTSIYDSPDKLVINPTDAYGKSFPTNLDDVKKFPSKNYNASTVIFYNEKNPGLDLIKLNNPVRSVPSNVCHLQVTRPWKVLDRLQIGINETYNHCYDSIKTFTAFQSSIPGNSRIDTTSWKWKLISPKNVKLNEIKLDKTSKIEYTPDVKLFTEIATTRTTESLKKYVPYTVSTTYSYKYKLNQDSLTCSDSTSIKVANEKVKIELDSVKVTCANYFLPVYFNSAEFIERFTVNGVPIDERDSLVWEYAGNKITEYPFNQKFSDPKTYNLVLKAVNYFGCKGIDSMKIIVKPSPLAKLSTNTVCYGLQNTLNGESSLPGMNSKISTYYWFYSSAFPPGEDPNIPDTTKAARKTKSNILMENFQVGDHPIGLAVKDSNGCFSKSDIKIAKVNKVPSIDFTATAKNTQDQDYLGNEPIQFDETSINAEYWKWNMGDGKFIESPTGTSSFDIEYTYPYFGPPFPKEKNMYDITLSVRTKEGCKDSVTKKVDVNAYFELPSAFSPNEDGLHDLLLGVGKGIKEIKEFKIYNR
ncbi:MAG: PKD domain-containing protein, partial [Opitutaceae bacterium]|nr:PKD domain-containing protein [Cytophagales bacterium]